MPQLAACAMELYEQDRVAVDVGKCCTALRVVSAIELSMDRRWAQKRWLVLTDCKRCRTPLLHPSLVPCRAPRATQLCGRDLPHPAVHRRVQEGGAMQGTQGRGGWPEGAACHTHVPAVPRSASPPTSALLAPRSSPCRHQRLPKLPPTCTPPLLGPADALPTLCPSSPPSRPIRPLCRHQGVFDRLPGAAARRRALAVGAGAEQPTHLQGRGAAGLGERGGCPTGLLLPHCRLLHWLLGVLQGWRGSGHRAASLTVPAAPSTPAPLCTAFLFLKFIQVPTHPPTHTHTHHTHTLLQVVHGGSNDVAWLQRDYSLFLLNVFDTEKACQVGEGREGPQPTSCLLPRLSIYTRASLLAECCASSMPPTMSMPHTCCAPLQVLGFQQRSLGLLLQRYCGVSTDKSFGQRADWRQR